MRPTPSLAKVASRIVAEPLCGAARAAAAASAEGHGAVGELDVFLRSMKAAQRRWAREIIAHESHVRRLMMVEEQCRARLRQQVLRGTREHLKYLTSTDLMAAAQRVSPPSVEVFLAYNIPSAQVSGFAVYVMSSIAADPNRLEVPLPVLIADLSSNWAIVPPRRKEAYNALAAIFREHLPESEAAAGLGRGRASPSANPGAKVPTQRQANSAEGSTRQRRPRLATSQSTAGAALSTAAETFISARHRLRPHRHAQAGAKKDVPVAGSSTASPSLLLAAGKDSESRRDRAASRRAARGVTRESRSSDGDVRNAKSPPRRRQPLVATRGSHLETALAAAERLCIPEGEREAFCCFAEESLLAMCRALDLPTPGDDAAEGRRRRLSAKAQPRTVCLSMGEWLPIAAEEWKRKTRRQKMFYHRRSAAA